jgi:hypothetical protein
MQMTDFVAEIANLQAQFQHVADFHPWVCLAMPAWGKVGIPTIGELIHPTAPPPEPPGKLLDGFGQPIPTSKPSLLEKAEYAKGVGSVRFFDEHGRDRDTSTEEVAKAIQHMEYLNSYEGMVELHGPPPWVLPPKDLRRQRITVHADALTCKAERLLLSVLEGPNQILAGTQELIQERNRQCPLWGWVAWLQYSVAISGPTWRIENYPQVAATALMHLRDVVGAKTEVLRPADNIAAGAPTGTATRNEMPSAETPPPSDSMDWKSAVAAVADENAVAIINIAGDATKTAEQKMRTIYAIDNRVVGWDSPKWASVLGVSDAAVRKTDWWIEDRPRLRA